MDCIYCGNEILPVERSTIKPFCMSRECIQKDKENNPPEQLAIVLMPKQGFAPVLISQMADNVKSSGR